MTQPMKPTDEQRKLVRTLAGYGTPSTYIASKIGCDEKTLRKYFRAELDNGMDEANSLVAQTLFKKAVGGDTASCIFWMKTRARWRETNGLEVSGPNGAPLAPAVINFVRRSEK